MAPRRKISVPGLGISRQNNRSPTQRTAHYNRSNGKELPLVFFEIGHDRLQGFAAHMMDDEVVKRRQWLSRAAP